MDYILQLDFGLFHYINQIWTHPWLDVFFPAITDLHKQTWFRTLVPLLLISFYYWKFQKRGLYYFFMGLFAIGLSDWTGSKLIKHNVERPRPYQTEGLEAIKRSPAGGFSFISNHSSNMFGFAFYQSQFIPQIKWFLYPIAALIAYSRVYNGVHFPTDVICGALWGLFISFIVFQLTRRLEKRIFKS